MLSMIGLVSIFIYIPTKVQHSFLRVSDICQYRKLDALNEGNYMLELTYIPMNQFQGGTFNPFNDLAMIRTAKEINSFNLDHLYDLEDSDAQCQINLRDPSVQTVHDRPVHEMLKSSHIRLQRKLTKLNNLFQYTPWALNPTQPYPCKAIITSFRAPLDSDMKPFDQIFSKIVEIICQNCSPDFSFCPVDLGIRVNFTNQSIYEQEPGTPNKKMAVIKISSQVPEYNYQKWEKFFVELTDALIDGFGIEIDWKSFWIPTEKIINGFKSQYHRRKKKFENLVKEADRDGMFLGNYISEIFTTELTAYQKHYRIQREDHVYQ